MTNEPTRDPSEIDPTLVRAELARILAHPEFAGAAQLSAFLTYVVERKLEGAEDRIKAYSIATEALGRPHSFDAQNDPIVRVQARRLRQALQIHYGGAPVGMRIDLPVGGYVPEFTAVHASPLVAPEPRSTRYRIAAISLVAALTALALALWAAKPDFLAIWDELTWTKPPVEANPLNVPAIAVNVSSERQIPAWFQPALFKTGLEFNLSRFDPFVVLSPLKPGAVPESAYRLDLEFTGAEGSVLGTARLMRGSLGKVVWSNRFTVPEHRVESYDALASVRRLSTSLGQPYGVLYSQLLGDPGKTESQICLLKGYEWFQRPVKDQIEPLSQCAERVLAKNPGNRIANIVLAMLDIERYRYRIGSDSDGALPYAFRLARHAIALKPDSAMGYLAMMDVQAVLGRENLSLESGAKALELNPNDSAVLAAYGCHLIYRGRYGEGRAHAAMAAQWNDRLPPRQRFCLFIAGNNESDLLAADAIARRLEGDAGPQADMAVAIAAARRGDLDKAQASLTRLVNYDNSYAVDPGQPLTLLGIFPDVAVPLIAALREAGLKSAQ